MPQLLLSTFPDRSSAEALAKRLVENQLAACVNILPGLSSVYRWQGQIETAEETLLLIKTDSHLFSELETVIKQHHPYQLPEIIAIDIAQGSGDYLHWLQANLKQPETGFSV